MKQCIIIVVILHFDLGPVLDSLSQLETVLVLVFFTGEFNSFSQAVDEFWHALRGFGEVLEDTPDSKQFSLAPHLLVNLFHCVVLLPLLYKQAVMGIDKEGSGLRDCVVEKVIEVDQLLNLFASLVFYL